MRLVEHCCPECQSVALAPMVALAEGDAGIWQCEGCDNAYRIWVEFRPVSPEKIQRRRDELPWAVESTKDDASQDIESPEEQHSEELQRRLLDIQLETERLHQLIDDLNSEAEHLKSEIEGE